VILSAYCGPASFACVPLPPGTSSASLTCTPQLSPILQPPVSPIQKAGRHQQRPRRPRTGSVPVQDEPQFVSHCIPPGFYPSSALGPGITLKVQRFTPSLAASDFVFASPRSSPRTDKITLLALLAIPIPPSRSNNRVGFQSQLPEPGPLRLVAPNNTLPARAKPMMSLHLRP
jgi:hypothetical protein